MRYEFFSNERAGAYTVTENTNKHYEQIQELGAINDVLNAAFAWARKWGRQSEARLWDELDRSQTEAKLYVALQRLDSDRA